MFTESGHNSQEYGGGNNGVCGVGWKQFDRPSGGWCMKVIQGQKTQLDAEATCRSEGATLSSLQNEQEILWITSAALNLFTERNGTLWIGAKRTAGCMTSLLTSTCNGITSFEWTDGSATGTAGFLWNRRQPDNDKRVQQCAALLAMDIPQSNHPWPWIRNRLDDFGCEDIGRDLLTSRGFVCGKRSLK
uniref:C-type lectin domain-containing protein n=1 Tax=Caenorhabditis tropicalis TaxID=1561998 RepID=A0A1I7T9Z1_9PELO